jgi:hypothetical protein
MLFSMLKSGSSPCFLLTYLLFVVTDYGAINREEKAVEGNGRRAQDLSFARCFGARPFLYSTTLDLLADYFITVVGPQYSYALCFCSGLLEQLQKRIRPDEDCLQVQQRDEGIMIRALCIVAQLTYTDIHPQPKDDSSALE